MKFKNYLKERGFIELICGGSCFKELHSLLFSGGGFKWLPTKSSLLRVQLT